MTDIANAHPVHRAQALTATGQLHPPQAKDANNAELDAIRRTARDFESMMLGEMLKPMFEGLDADGPFGGGQAEETWRGLMIQEYGAEISRSGGIGIADQLVRQMLQIQENSG